MARTKVGQAVFEAWRDIRDEKLLNAATLKEIGRRQGEFIRLQNLAAMARGLDRNGVPMAPYAPRTVEERLGAQKRLKHRKKTAVRGLQVKFVDLKRTGKFWKSINVRDVTARVEKGRGVAVIAFNIGVASEEMAARLVAFRTGRFGRFGRAPSRDPVGMADEGTTRGKAQRKELKRIAMETYRKELRGASMAIAIRDVGEL